MTNQKRTQLNEFSRARLKEEIRKDLDPLSPTTIEATRAYI
jgi:hypothetical protein